MNSKSKLNRIDVKFPELKPFSYVAVDVHVYLVKGDGTLELELTCEHKLTFNKDRELAILVASALNKWIQEKEENSN